MKFRRYRSIPSMLVGLSAIALLDRLVAEEPKAKTAGESRKIVIVDSAGDPVEGLEVHWQVPKRDERVIVEALIDKAFPKNTFNFDQNYFTDKHGVVELADHKIHATELMIYNRDMTLLRIRAGTLEWPLRVEWPDHHKLADKAPPERHVLTVLNAAHKPIKGAVIRWTFTTVLKEKLERHYTDFAGQVDMPTGKGHASLYIDTPDLSLSYGRDRDNNHIPDQDYQWPKLIVLPTKKAIIEDKNLLQ